MDAATAAFLQAYNKATPQQKALIDANVANYNITGTMATQAPTSIIANLPTDQQAQILNQVAQNSASLQGMSPAQQQALLSMMGGTASIGRNAINQGYLSYIYNNPQALQSYATANGMTVQQLQPYVDALTAYYDPKRQGGFSPYQSNTMKVPGAGPGAGPSGTGTTGTSTTGTPEQNDAFAQIQQVLQQYGLGDLSSWAWQEIIGGKSTNQVLISMYDQPTFQNRFPGIAAMRAAGLAVPKPADYLNLENDYKTVLKRYGMPVSDKPQDYVQLMVGQVSASELEQRSSMYDKIVNVYGPRLQQQFQDYAGIHGVSHEQLYSMMAGTDNGSLAAKYSAATNTEFGPLTFAHIQDAEAKAESAMKAEFMAGGIVATGPSAGQEEQTIRSRAAANLTTTPVSTQPPRVGGSI